MKDIPVYRFPAEHARENGELELYRASNKANAALQGGHREGDLRALLR